MIRPLILGVVAFFLALGFFALVAWTGGFDFDKRNPDVACGLFMSVLLSLVAGAAAFFYADEAFQRKGRAR